MGLPPVHTFPTRRPIGSRYRLMAVGQICNSRTVIRSEHECRAAAQFIGRKFYHARNGPGDFPACLMAHDHRNGVFLTQIIMQTLVKTATGTPGSAEDSREVNSGVLPGPDEVERRPRPEVELLSQQWQLHVCLGKYTI